MHAATILMTVVMIIAFLSSIAIVRRILMATSVLKASMTSICFYQKYSSILILLHYPNILLIRACPNFFPFLLRRFYLCQIYVNAVLFLCSPFTRRRDCT